MAGRPTRPGRAPCHCRPTAPTSRPPADWSPSLPCSPPASSPRDRERSASGGWRTGWNRATDPPSPTSVLAYANRCLDFMPLHLSVFVPELDVGHFLETQPNPKFLRPTTPFPQIDIIGAVVIVWKVRGKTIRSVLCNIVCNNCAQCDAHTYEQTNSSLYWVLSHWAHFTVLRFIFVLCIAVCCMHA